MQPAGAAFDDALHGVAQEGQIVTEEVVINSISTALNTPTADVSVKLRGIYTPAGMKVNTAFMRLPTGIYIVDGKKAVKK